MLILCSPGCLLQVHGIKCKIGGYLNKRMHTHVWTDYYYLYKILTSHRKVFFLSGKMSQVTWYQNYEACINFQQYWGGYKITENNKETYRKMLTHFQKSLGRTKDQVHVLIISGLSSTPSSSSLPTSLHASDSQQHRIFDNLIWTINTLVKWISQ